ncbi:MAG: DUF58 domain-containing protein [Chloroflexales bacterium]|nr:DUF58 domain-containing protein [Chloroflexales bacterium]
MWFKTILRRNRSVRDWGIRRGSTTPRASRAPQFALDEALLRRLERLALEARRTLQGSPNSGEHPSRERLPASVFSEHRPYAPGDDYRSVDWNAYARHEQVVVKLGEIEQDINVHVLLDCSASMLYGTPTKLIAAQQLAAAIGYVALVNSDRLRLTAIGAQSVVPWGPAQGKARSVEMLRHLRELQSGGTAALGQALQRYARQHERGGLLVLCSDLLATPAEGLDLGLRELTPPRWQVLVLHTLDRREVAPELGETVDLEDAETGERLAVTLDGETLDGYRKNVAAWQETLAAACNRRGATYAQVLSDWPFERAVVPFLRMRRILR